MSMTPANALAFFASVIKSGEPWTPSCQQAYDEAMSHLARPRAVPEAFIEDIQRAERLALKSKKLNRERMMGLAVVKHLSHLFATAKPAAQPDPGWPAPFEVVQSWALANGYSGATDAEACKAYREAHPALPAMMFETPEALATWLDSLHECDAGGTVSNRKFEAAQIAATAIRLQLSRKD